MSQNKKLSIFEDREALIAILLSYESHAKFVIDKIWKSAQFFTTISTTLLAISAAFLGSKTISTFINSHEIVQPKFFAIIPFIVIIISIIGVLNLKREYERFLEWITSIIKIQEMLGLFKEISSERFKADRYINSYRVISTNWESSEKFISENLKSKKTLYYYFKILHFIFIGIAVCLFILFLCL